MLRRSAFLVALFEVASCGRCGEKKPPETLGALLPSTARAVVVVPSLARAFLAARGLASALARFPGGDAVGQKLDAAAASLGFDPGSAGALSAVGIAADRPAALVAERDGVSLLLPVADRGRLVQAIARLAVDRAGAGHAEERRVPGGELRLFTGGRAPVALGLRGDWALLSEDPDLVRRGLTRDRKASLAGDERVQAGLHRLGVAWDAWALVPAGSDLLDRTLLPKQPWFAATSFSRRRLLLRVLSPLTVGEGAGLAAFSLPAGQDLVPLLSPDDVLVFRIGGELSGLAGMLAEALPIAPALAAAGLDLRRDLLFNLRPGITLGAGIAPGIQLSAISSAGSDPEDVASLMTIDAFVRVREVAKAKAALQRLCAAAPLAGGRVVLGAIAGHPVATFEDEKQRRMSVALVGDTLALAEGEGAMAAALARIDGKGARYQASRLLERALLGHVSDGAALDTDALRAAVERIPEAAYGGLEGLTLRAIVGSFLAPLAHVGPLVVTADISADAAVADAEVELR